MKTNPSLISLNDYEIEASKVVDKTFFDFFRSGAGNELTLNLNRKIFDR